MRGDPGDFQFEGYPYKRLRVIQSEVNKFWKKWCQLAGPNLFVRSKWHAPEKSDVTSLGSGTRSSSGRCAVRL